MSREDFSSLVGHVLLVVFVVDSLIDLTMMMLWRKREEKYLLLFA